MTASTVAGATEHETRWWPEPLSIGNLAAVTQQTSLQRVYADYQQMFGKTHQNILLFYPDLDDFAV